MHDLKRIEKTIWENAFEKEKKKPGSKYNLRLALPRKTAAGDLSIVAERYSSRKFNPKLAKAQG